ARDPIWHVSLGPSIPSSDFDWNGVAWRDITVEVGITSTPAIDLASNVMYVVAKTKESDAQFYRIHALDLATGPARARTPPRGARGEPDRRRGVGAPDGARIDLGHHPVRRLLPAPAPRDHPVPRHALHRFRQPRRLPRLPRLDARVRRGDAHARRRPRHHTEL